MRTIIKLIVIIAIISVILLIIASIYFLKDGVINPTPTPTLTLTPSSTPTPTSLTPMSTVAQSLRHNGICYGPFRDGQSPDVGIYPTSEQVREDLIVLKGITDKMRIYSSTNISAQIPGIAKQLGMSVCQGVYLSADRKKNEAEVESTINLAKQGLVDSIVVGNEILLTGVLNESDIIQYVRQVKQNVPANVNVTTAEPYSQWFNHPNLAKEVDYILIHVHPYWEDQAVDEAAQFVVDRYNDVKATYPDKEVVIGETGWPSAGNSTWTGVSGKTVASEVNEKRFIEDFVQLANKNSIKYFYFDAIDEEFKWMERKASGNIDSLTTPLDRTFSGRLTGSSWGIFQSNGSLKPQLEVFFPSVSSIVSRTTRPIFVNGQLQVGYDMGVDSSEQRRDWLSNTTDGSMQMAYPSGESWGAVFMTVGTPVNQPRPWKDFSSFQTLSVTLRGEKGGESVQLGIKDSNDPDDGNETKITLTNVSSKWQRYTFPLPDFKTADLRQLYVATEFVFSGSTAQTVYFKEVTYLPSPSTTPTSIPTTTPTPTPIPSPTLTPISTPVSTSTPASTPTVTPTPTPTPEVGDVYEPDNSFTQYSTVDIVLPLQYQNRSIEPAGDNDYIRFYAKPGIYVFYTSSTIDTYGYLYNSNQNQLLSDDESGGNHQFRMLYNLTVDGYYFLSVRAYSVSTIGNYTLYFQYQSPTPPETVGNVYTGTTLSTGYDMGVDSSNRRTDWLADMNGSMRMSYPSGQSWGAVFITVGVPTNPPRLSKDMSLFKSISIQLRGERGGESVQIGIKDSDDPDDGTETKVTITNLSTQWQTYTFPLPSFTTADLSKLYVVTEFVFSGSAPQTVYFKNIIYKI